MEATLGQLQQSHAPGIGIAMFLDAEQVTVGRGDIGADQHGLTGLENLVVGGDADGGEILLVVEVACRADGLEQDVVDRS